MKIKLFYTFIGVASVSILYFYIFMKSEAVEDPHLLTLCKKDNHIEVNLLDSFHYIDKYKIIESQDTIKIYVYTTTIGNFIDKKKMTQFNIYHNDKIVMIKDRILKSEDIKNCN